MNVIRELRRFSGLTQSKLSAEAGTSQATIAAYEAGRKSPTLKTVEKIATAVGIRIHWRYQKKPTREEQRSLAYHEAVRELLSTDEAEILRIAKQNLRKMKQMHPHATRLFNLWRAWLDLPVPTLRALIVEQSELAADMRQVTPFAGVLSAEKRMEILKRFSAGSGQ